MPTNKLSSNRESRNDPFSIEEALHMSEASVRLEGIDPTANPEYLALKARVLAGEITSDEAGNILIAQNTQTQTTAA